jgi:WD40 repeat protein
MQDIFTNPIMDISWSKHPIGLLCCSYDGTVSYLEFSDEVGYPLSQQELETLFKVNYSVDLNERPIRATQLTDKPKFIENIDVLLAQESKENTEPVAKSLSARSQSSTSTRRSSIIENQTQIERKLPDGRRRITPICVAKAGDL